MWSGEVLPLSMSALMQLSSAATSTAAGVVYSLISHTVGESRYESKYVPVPGGAPNGSLVR